EAMVNIRATIEAARAAEVVDAAGAEAVLSAAKAVFYKDRSWDPVLRQARRHGLRPGAAATLRDWLPGNAIDVKRADACALIEAMLSWHRSGAPGPPRCDFVRTAYWDDLQRRLGAGSSAG